MSDAGRVIDTMVPAFERHYAAQVLVAQDKVLGQGLAYEAKASLEALFAALNTGDGVQDAMLGEAFSAVNWLGQRLGEQGTSVAAVLAVMQAIVNSLAEQNLQPAPEVWGHLNAIYMEGYLTGRQGRWCAQIAQRSVEDQVVVDIVPGCVAVFLHGQHDTEAWANIADGVGRELFSRQAKACVIDMAQLRAPQDGSAGEIVNLDGTARMLGVHCVFSRVHASWLQTPAQTGEAMDLLLIVPTFEAAMAHALTVCGWNLAKKRDWISALGQVWGRSTR